MGCVCACMGVIQLGFQQAQNEDFSLPQEMHGYEGTLPGSWLYH